MLAGHNSLFFFVIHASKNLGSLRNKLPDLYLFHTGNTVLIVAHASSLEACTRQIQGLTPQNSKDFVQVVRKVSLLF